MQKTTQKPQEPQELQKPPGAPRGPQRPPEKPPKTPKGPQRPPRASQSLLSPRKLREGLRIAQGGFSGPPDPARPRGKKPKNLYLLFAVPHGEAGKPLWDRSVMADAMMTVLKRYLNQQRVIACRSVVKTPSSEDRHVVVVSYGRGSDTETPAGPGSLSVSDF